MWCQKIETGFHLRPYHIHKELAKVVIQSGSLCKIKSRPIFIFLFLLHQNQTKFIGYVFSKNGSKLWWLSLFSAQNNPSILLCVWLQSTVDIRIQSRSYFSLLDFKKLRLKHWQHLKCEVKIWYLTHLTTTWSFLWPCSDEISIH